MNKKIVAILIAFLLFFGGCDKSNPRVSDASTDIGPVDVPAACIDSGVEDDSGVTTTPDAPEYNGCSQ